MPAADMQRMKAWNLTKLSNENLINKPASSGGMVPSESMESLQKALKNNQRAAGVGFRSTAHGAGGDMAFQYMQKAPTTLQKSPVVRSRQLNVRGKNSTQQGATTSASVVVGGELPATNTASKAKIHNLTTTQNLTNQDIIYSKKSPMFKVATKQNPISGARGATDYEQHLMRV